MHLETDTFFKDNIFTDLPTLIIGYINKTQRTIRAAATKWHEISGKSAATRANKLNRADRINEAICHATDARNSRMNNTLSLLPSILAKFCQASRTIEPLTEETLVIQLLNLPAKSAIFIHILGRDVLGRA